MRRRKPSAARAAASPVRPAPRRGVHAIVTGAVTLVAIAIVAWVIVSRSSHVPAPAKVDSSQAPIALSYAQLGALAGRVKTLLLEEHYAEAVPEMRTLIEQQKLQGQLGSTMVVGYGLLLNNAAFESGAWTPRSSYERIALEQRALASANTALGMARTPHEKAEAITLVGLVHETWGFPYDAYLAYRAALGTDATYDVARQHYDKFLNRLKLAHPPAPK